MAEIDLKTIETVSNQPFRKLVTTIGELPSAFIESMSHYEMLAWLVDWLENTVIPAVNNNAEALKELQKLFVELKTFVDDYFENLDVQDEINNKLDQMADDGVLQEIITEYIQSNVAWTFDTVADMKLATNLVDGSFARTLGFHTINDGGGALYKVTNTGTANEMDVISINNNLFAELIKPVILNPEIYGAYGDGTHDDTVVLQYMFDQHNPSVLSKNYLISSTIRLSGDNINVNAASSIINYTGATYGFLIQNINGGNIRFGGVKALNGTCIRIYSEVGSGDYVQYLNLYFNRLEALDKCIDMKAEQVGWVNEVHIYGGQILRGLYGVYYVNDTDEDNYGSNGIYCHNIGFEGTTNNYYFESNYHVFRGITLENDRYVENTTSTHLTLKGKFSTLKMDSWGGLKESRLNFTEATALYWVSIHCPIVKEDGTSTFALGIEYDDNNRKTYTHKRKLSPTITPNSDAFSAGNIRCKKRGNLCIICVDGVTPTATNTDLILASDPLPADFRPSTDTFIPQGSLATNEGHTARFWIRQNGSMGFSCVTDGLNKQYFGELVYDPELINS